MALVESQTGIDFGENLHIGFSLDMTYVGFDVWYQTDKELEIAKASGFDRKLTKILERSAREYLNAESNVWFHSHQTVLEKCGGNYFQYLR